MFAVAMLTVGCAGGSSVETTGAFTSLDPTEGNDDTTSGGATATDDPSTTTADTDAATSGGATTTPSTTTATSAATDGGETTDPATTSADASSSSGETLPPQPDAGWWSHCLSNPDCTADDPDLLCLLNTDSTDGVCIGRCEPAGNAASCDASPGGTAEPRCLTVGVGSYCALDCSGGRTCPAGMICLSDEDDVGPIEICI